MRKADDANRKRSNEPPVNISQLPNPFATIEFNYGDDAVYLHPALFLIYISPYLKALWEHFDGSLIRVILFIVVAPPLPVQSK